MQHLLRNTIILSVLVPSFAYAKDRAVHAVSRVDANTSLVDESPSSESNRAPQGFMLRTTIGPAGLGAKVDDGAHDINIAGGVAALGMEAGGRVAPNLVLHGDILVVGASKDASLAEDDSDFEAQDLGTAAAGAGVTYFLPYGVSVGGSALFAVAGMQSDDDVSETVAVNLNDRFRTAQSQDAVAPSARQGLT